MGCFPHREKRVHACMRVSKLQTDCSGFSGVLVYFNLFCNMKVYKTLKASKDTDVYTSCPLLHSGHGSSAPNAKQSATASSSWKATMQPVLLFMKWQLFWLWASLLKVFTAHTQRLQIKTINIYNSATVCTFFLTCVLYLKIKMINIYNSIIMCTLSLSLEFSI